MSAESPNWYCSLWWDFLRVPRDFSRGDTYLRAALVKIIDITCGVSMLPRRHKKVDDLNRFRLPFVFSLSIFSFICTLIWLYWYLLRFKRFAEAWNFPRRKNRLRIQRHLQFAFKMTKSVNFIPPLSFGAVLFKSHCRV